MQIEISNLFLGLLEQDAQTPCSRCGFIFDDYVTTGQKLAEEKRHVTLLRRLLDCTQSELAIQVIKFDHLKRLVIAYVLLAMLLGGVLGFSLHLK